MPIEIITLGTGHFAPAGSDWLFLAPVDEMGCALEGSIEAPRGVMSRYGEYENTLEAMEAGIAFAMERGCRLLYVEAAEELSLRARLLRRG